MPPTRGHDLKPLADALNWAAKEMPPTRGHDLKLILRPGAVLAVDAPHTGARLETAYRQLSSPKSAQMPPTRGHDLKP